MIEIQQLTKKYGEIVVFQQTDYTFPKQGLVCVLGASGCGKTTLLQLLAGFDCDYEGTIKVGNVNLHNQSEEWLCNYRRDQIGFIFQDYHLLHGYTVVENIMIASKLRDIPIEEQHQKALALLAQVGMSDKANQKVENLSGGQKQRVAIVRALMGEPSFLLADEVTGALDRENANQIMGVLKQIAQDKLVIVITHDKKITSYADEILTIEDGNIIATKDAPRNHGNESLISMKPTKKISAWSSGFKNFKVHLIRHLSVAFAISIGIFAFLLSLSFGNVMAQSIQDFKDKNTAFNNGFIKVEQNEADIQNILASDKRIENIYKQYKLKDITLQYGDKKETIPDRFPTPKATQSMSYGRMPKKGEKQIALSPSLAKKYMQSINELIGKEIILSYEGHDYVLTVTGIFNAEFDDFFVSSDIEQQLYKDKDEESYAISYDVTTFDDVVSVSNMLKDQEIYAKDAATEVDAFQTTFQTIQRLFLIVSGLILLICFFISTILLMKLQQSRYREIGLLSALGFPRSYIRKMIVIENLLLATLASFFNVIWMSLGIIICSSFVFPFTISAFQLSCAMLVTFIVIEVISIITSYKLLHTEPAVALKK